MALALVQSTEDIAQQVENKAFEITRFQKPVYEYLGGYKVYCELLSIKVLVVGTGNFDARVAITKTEHTTCTPRELVNISCKFISKVAQMGLSHILSQFDIHDLKNHEKAEMTVPFAGNKFTVSYEVEAAPEYAPGDLDKKAIDIFREKNGREPTDDIISNSTFKPVFKVSIV